jgi:hypothetical protein
LLRGQNESGSIHAKLLTLFLKNGPIRCRAKQEAKIPSTNSRAGISLEGSTAPFNQFRRNGQADAAGEIRPSRAHTSLQERCQLAAEE